MPRFSRKTAVCWATAAALFISSASHAATSIAVYNLNNSDPNGFIDNGVSPNAPIWAYDYIGEGNDYNGFAGYIAGSANAIIRVPGGVMVFRDLGERCGPNNQYWYIRGAYVGGTDIPFNLPGGNSTGVNAHAQNEMPDWPNPQYTDVHQWAAGIWPVAEHTQDFPVYGKAVGIDPAVRDSAGNVIAIKAAPANGRVGGGQNPYAYANVSQCVPIPTATVGCIAIITNGPNGQIAILPDPQATFPAGGANMTHPNFCATTFNGEFKHVVMPLVKAIIELGSAAAGGGDAGDIAMGEIDSAIARNITNFANSVREWVQRAQ